jgi:hypothetical protein
VYVQRKRAQGPKKRRKSCAHNRRYREMPIESGRAKEGLLVRAEPLKWAEEISHRMVDVVRIIDGALLLDADPAWAEAINMVLVNRGVRVSELVRSSLYSPGSPQN